MGGEEGKRSQKARKGAATPLSKATAGNAFTGNLSLVLVSRDTVIQETGYQQPAQATHFQVATQFAPSLQTNNTISS